MQVTPTNNPPSTFDPYHSRVSPQPEMAARQDPVLWGDEQGPLGAEDLASYEERGFLVVPDLFTDDEVSALLEEAHALAAAADRSRDDVISEPGGGAIRSLFRLHVESERFYDLAADPRLVGVARQILGSSVYVHQSRMNFKPAFEGKSFPWHSDFETWHIEDGMPRMRALSASLLLSPNTEHNGPLLLIPGSHKTYVRCVGETPEEHFKQSLKHQEYGVPDRAALTEMARRGGLASATGPAGTVVFFDCNTMHGSAGNITPLPRHNLFLVYNSVDNRLVAPFGGTRPRPGFLAERDPAAFLA